MKGSDSKYRSGTTAHGSIHAACGFSGFNMSRLATIALATTCILSIIGCRTENSPTKDDRTKKMMLVGTWINPPGSPDYRRVPSREILG
jgi:hypothetical protein